MNRHASLLWGIAMALVSFLLVAPGARASYNLPDPYEWISQPHATDTIPLDDRFGNWVEDSLSNPFDLLDPEEVVQSVEYDPITNTYILTEKIGNENYRPPTVMTFEEYLEWNAQQEEADYFKQLAGAADGDRSKSGNLDPVAQVDISDDIIDRLFGGTTVDIRPQGNVDLTFGLDYYRQDNPILPVDQQRYGPQFDFDMDIQVDVNGKIGEKLTTSFNYNTARTFDFQNRLKLSYDAEQFSEDDIIKTIEAGDVSLPLKSNLIQGSQSLFGIKTELQFGHLRFTALASQQNSKQSDIKIEGGSTLQEFTVYADQYDENRHFLLSHFNRANFESTLKNLPQINSLFSITRIEVWVTNDRNQTTDVRDIVAISDLGEWEVMTNDEPDKWRNPDTTQFMDICMENILPDNNTNFILPEIAKNPALRDLDNVVKGLQAAPFNFESPRDFEKIQARKLTFAEYRFHPELGIISLNIRLDQDEVLGVAFEYTYNGRVFQVGEFSQDGDNTDTSGNQKVLFVKMLKSTNQRVDLPLWDLMMKNIYRISGGDLNPEEFELDIYYDNTSNGFNRFLPAETGISNRPLLDLFGLDRLNVTGDPQPDGRFDFVPGITIIPPLGVVMFPVLEPFGTTLANAISAPPEIEARYVYQQLYDSTVVKAREFPELNRFALRGKAETTSSSEISLGAFNIPPGSVRVTAGGQTLRENEDYIIDYNIGRIKILNPAYLQPNTPINVSFEDNALFSFNRKTMLGFRADYEVTKNLSVGGTYLHLFERPYTQKVNIGDDPINNRIYGLDMNYSDEQPWLTKLVDKIPLINTTAPSNLTFEAEMAALRPSHSRAIDISRGDGDGVVYLDDFEGTTSNFDLRSPTIAWVLASTPQDAELDGQKAFLESELIDSVVYGANRAHLNWYRIDEGARNESQDAYNFPYSRPVSQEEIFPFKTPTFGLNDFRTFDLTYIPDQRGPYNFDTPDGYLGYTQGIDFNCKLNAPETRWGGIMRSLNQVNFEQANIEAIEFWMMDPFLDPADTMGSEGKIIFHLGNISEDILRDSRKVFEHGLPRTPEEAPTDTTNWGRIPRIPPTVNAFSNNESVRQIQDVGLDGLTDDQERLWFGEWLASIQGNVTFECLTQAQRDPGNDNFVYFLDDNVYPPGTNLFQRYHSYNGTHGNSPPPETGQENVAASTNIPDSEDINNDNTMSETESYYEYVVQIEKDPNGSDQTGNLNPNNPLITDIVNTPFGSWYRFKIPIAEYTRAVGGINDFRSIRFMRMLLTQFNRRTTLRFATFDLVRNQWREITRNQACGMDGIADIVVDAVNIEEHSNREPFRYDIPLGIDRERITSSTYQDVYQNEQSLALKFSHMEDGCERKVYKQLDLDLRVFKKVQMFVHAEEADMNDPKGQIPDKAVKLFIRFGSDFDNNYYEYEVPLIQSKNPNLIGDEYKFELWRPENEVLFTLEDFTNLKIERNEMGIPPTELYSKAIMQEINGILVERTLRIVGNPTLGYVRNVIIGVRNTQGDDCSDSYFGEVWVNELRMVGLDEKGGVAGLARLDADLADFGSVGLSGTYTSIGWGALDQKLDDRAKESVTQVDLSTNLELGKFLGPNSGVQIPFYYQYSETFRNPQYDALDLDLPLDEKLRSIDDQDERDSVREQSQDVNRLKQISFTNVRKNPGGGPGGAPKPWDISNFTASYSYTKTFARNEVVEKDEVKQHLASLDYAYSLAAKPIEPFKNVSKSNWMKWLTEFNFNPVPNSFTFGTVMDRKFGERSYRFSDPIYKTWYDKRFTWVRTYSLRWDFTKSLKFNFNAANAAVVDEPDEYIDRLEGQTITKAYRQDSIWNNILEGGRTKDYTHQIRATWSVPLKTIPLVDWIRADLSYDANYSWKAAALNTDSLGNEIQNGQTGQISMDFDLVKLYNKSKFLAQANKTGGPPAGGNNQNKQPPSRQTPDPDPNQPVQPQPKPEKKNTGMSPPLKTLMRFAMMVRKFRVNYTEGKGTTIPGFEEDSEILGMDHGFGAPGWSFISGIQPKINRRAEQETGDYLDEARSNEWIVPNAFQSAPVLQFENENLDSRLSLEPFTDFKIDVDFIRGLSNNFSVFFKTYNKSGNTYADLARSSPRDIGSLTMSWLQSKTLFMDDSLELNQLFDQFESNRSIISKIRGVGVHEVDGPNYTEGFGRKQQDVLVPAFIAAYTGKSPENFEFTDIWDWLPRPNWTLTYNGLNKIPMFKRLFTNIRITHGYKSTLTINNFQSDLSYDDYNESTGEIEGQQNPDNLDSIKLNYYSQFLVPSIIIDEAFAPLIGVDAKFQNGMGLSFGFTKRRGLGMSFTDYRLNEARSTTVDVGFDWTLKDVRIGFLPGFNSAANKKKEPSRNPGQGTPKEGNDLQILFDFSFADNLTIIHELDQDIGARPTRGSKDITISPSISYDINKNVNLRFFVDYRRQQPYVSNSYLVINTQGGVTVRVRLE